MTANELATTAATHLNLANTVLKTKSGDIKQRRYFQWVLNSMPRLREWVRMRYEYTNVFGLASANFEGL